MLAQILARWCFLLVSGPWCKCIEGGFENWSSVFYSKAAAMSDERKPTEQAHFGLKIKRAGTLSFNGEDPQMGQIDGHRVSLGRRVARGQAPELISYGQTHETIKPFRLSGLRENRGSPPSTAFQIPEAETPKRTRTVDQE
jgi:hypothetical protein